MTLMAKMQFEINMYILYVHFISDCLVQQSVNCCIMVYNKKIIELHMNILGLSQVDTCTGDL